MMKIKCAKMYFNMQLRIHYLNRIEVKEVFDQYLKNPSGLIVNCSSSNSCEKMLQHNKHSSPLKLSPSCLLIG